MSVHRFSRPATRYRLAALLAIVLAAFPLAMSQSPRAVAGDEHSPPVSLYVLTYVPQPVLQPLDPATLAPLPDQQPFQFDKDLEVWDADFSADGSTLVTIGKEKDTFGPVFAIVRDGTTFQERRRFDVPGTTWLSTLSEDGSRLVVRADAGEVFAPTMRPIWQVFDTGTGLSLSSVEADPATDSELASVTDGDAQRLYRLTTPPLPADSSQISAPVTARIVVNDLTTGAELGRIDLPDVRAGYWTSPKTTIVQGTEMHLPSHLSPALARSADGSHLAVVHADEDEVTLIDTERLAIDRAVAFAPRRSRLDGLLGLVPLWPQEASAKFMNGAIVEAIFSPDGRYLYVTGSKGSVEDGESVMASLGLRTIDVDSGEVVSSIVEDAWFGRVVPAPDGRSLYVSSYGATNGIRHLDPRTLDLRAERFHSDFPLILVAPKTGRVDM